MPFSPSDDDVVVQYSTQPASFSSYITDKDSYAQIPDATAVTQVGQTVELIELILSHLPPLDIVTATAVNKTFRNVVFSSHTLQKKLFLRPTNALPLYWLPLKRCPPISVFQTTTVDADSDIFEPTAGWRMELLDFSPLRVVYTCPLLERPSEAEGFWAHPATSLDKLEWQPISSSPNQWYLLPTKEITGPWKNMFLTNPPCKSVQCTLLWEGWVRGVLDITLEATRNVHRKEGVTWADLIEETCSTTGRVDIHTANKDESPWAIPCENGGYQYSILNSTLQEHIEACKKRNSEREMRLNNHSTVALLWTVALTDDERREMAARIEDKFFFTQTPEAAKGPKWLRRGRSRE